LINFKSKFITIAYGSIADMLMLLSWLVVSFN